LACDVIERTQHPHLLGLSWRWHPQVGAGIRSRPREIGMRQRLTPVVVRQNDVTGFGVAFTQVQTKADPIHLAGCLPSLQDVPGLPPTELFSRRLGKLRPADANTLAHLDFRSQMGNRPVRPVGHGLFEQWCCYTTPLHFSPAAAEMRRSPLARRHRP